MRKLRYKFYAVLLIIFIIITIVFASTIIVITNYNKNNIENTYYDAAYKIILEEIRNTAENLREDIIKENYYKFNNVNNLRYETYVQKIISFYENNISIYNVYNSKYREVNNTYKSYNKNSQISKEFYPTYKIINNLMKTSSVLDEEIFYNKDISYLDKRIFYSCYIAEKDLIITVCFYKSELKKELEEYLISFEEENTENIKFFIIEISIVMLALFIIIYCLELRYHKRIKKYYIQERTKTIEKYKALKRISQTDPLTKCYNRQYLIEKLSIAFKRFKERNLSSSIILFDIDDFKKINDTYGHNAGDKVLIEISRTVKEYIRKEDIPVRWGGEEFIIFFKYTNINSVLIIGEKIRSAIEELTIRTEKEEIKVTISIGISGFKEFDLEPIDCIERADDAMYISKKTGKNKITLYDDR